MTYLSKQEPRGITLLISIILTTVILSVALALFDITYKQVLLASSAKQSQYAFYNADAGMECALYWDQKIDAFDYAATSYLTNGFSCADNQGNAQTITITPPSYTGSGSSPANSTNQANNVRTTVFSIPCTGGGTQALVTVTKSNTGSTTLFSTGYNTCTISDPRRIERGLKVTYGGVVSGGGGGGGGGTELIPQNFASTSNYVLAYSGLTAANGMRDGNYVLDASTHGTNSGANQAITADLGSAQALGSVALGSIASTAPRGWGPSYVNGAVIEGSLDNSAYTTLVASVAYPASVDGTTVSYPVAGTYRYIRVRQAAGYLGLGEFRIYAP